MASNEADTSAAPVPPKPRKTSKKKAGKSKFGTWSPAARRKRKATMDAKRAAGWNPNNARMASKSLVPKSHKTGRPRNADISLFPLEAIPERIVRRPVKAPRTYVNDSDKLDLAKQILDVLSKVLGS